MNTPEDYLKFLQTSDRNENCPVLRSLKIFEGKWNIRIIYELAIQETVRFNELQRNISNISQASLSRALKDLQDKGIITRKQYNEIPPKVEYSLTEKGKALLPVFFELYKWGNKYLEEGECSEE